MNPLQIINDAIAQWQPSSIIIAYSGGYDSMVLAHAATRLKSDGKISLPISTWAIDTKLSADGWVDWIKSTSPQLGQAVNVYDNQAGFDEYFEWVSEYGNPYTNEMHKRAYRRLKDTAFSALLKMYKKSWTDKILFLSGIRAAESTKRASYDPINRRGKSNAIFANPLFDWSDEEMLTYRIEFELPENPFYETVGGSGDCQCNWGRFITLARLKMHSPDLAGGNVNRLDKVGLPHGYHWDGQPANQMQLLPDEEMCSPFLCDGCSRSKSPQPGLHKAQDYYYENQMSVPVRNLTMGASDRRDTQLKLFGDGSK